MTPKSKCRPRPPCCAVVYIRDWRDELLGLTFKAGYAVHTGTLRRCETWLARHGPSRNWGIVETKQKPPKQSKVETT